MCKKTFFVLILILSILSVSIIGASASESHLDGEYKIFLKTGEIDTRNTYATAETEVSVASSSSAPIAESEESFYIVQFTGKVLPEWKDEIKLLEAAIYDYVPNNAYVIRMNDSQKEQVSSIEFVQWIGEYKPAYKLSPPVTSSSIQMQSTSTNTVEEFIITLFDSKDNNRIADEISSIGGEVLQHSETYLRVKVPDNKIADLSLINGISWIENYSEPVLSNDVATTIMNVELVHSNHGLNGSGQIVAVADTGLDTGVDDNSMHDDIEGRIINITDYSNDGAADYNGHGTHVAGSVLGNGVMSGGQYKGAAPEASLVFQSLEASGSLYLPTDLATIFQSAYDDGARIHTNSWSYAGSGAYTTRSRQVDQFTWDNPDMLILFSAGNYGSDSDENGVVDLDSITPPSTSKNCIAVGASESDRGDGFGTAYTIWGGTTWLGGLFTTDPIKNDYTANNPEGIAAFSSRGPTEDGRIKPDLVAPGTFIASTRSSQPSWYEWGGIDNYYAYSSGTSMSTPLVAGSAALVREYYTDIEQLENPSAALLKATLINGAHDATPGQYGTGAAQEIKGIPDYSQGWGLVDVENSLFPEYPKVMTYYDKNSLNMSDSWTIDYGIFKESEPVRLTLTWTDFPGAAFASTTLVNDLNLKVIGPDNAYYGNGGTVADDKNNVEGIEIISPITGNYAINVDGHDVQHGPQNFSLVLSFTCENNNFPENASTTTSGTIISTDVVHPADVNASSIIMKVDGTTITTFSSTNIPYGQHVEYDSSSSYAIGNHNITIIASTLSGRQFEYEWEFNVEASTEKEITAFEFSNPEVTATINETARTVTATVPHGTDITTLTPTIVHTGKEIAPSSGVAQNFTIPIIYTVTAEDSSEKTYTVTVTKEPSTEKEITAFEFSNPAVTATINETSKIIVATVPHGTDRTALVPIIDHTGKSVSPDSGIAQDFSNAVIYTVTAEDSSERAYTVAVTEEPNTEKEITSFEFSNPAVTATINETVRTIAATVPHGTDITSLAPTVVHTGKEIAPGSGVAQDFSNTVTYTVTAEDSSEKTYTVAVTEEPNTEKEITSFEFSDPAVTATINETSRTITATVPYETNVTALTPTIVHTGEEISPESGVALNFSIPIIYTLTAEDSSTKTYTATVNVLPSSAKEISSFSFEAFDPIINGSIDEATNNISLTVAYETNVTALVPTINHTGNSISPNTGVEQNFTNPIIYTVTAADNTIQNYTVTVTVVPDTTTETVAITTTGGGGGGGGGGGNTGETYENIEFKDVNSIFIGTGNIEFAFSSESNDIQYIRFESLKNAGKTSTTIEVLHDISALVNSAPSGIVYRNINIWVGKTGYATENNIDNPVIGFKVKKDWIESYEIDVDSITLNRYDGGRWKQLSTSNTDSDDRYLYFKSRTDGFSSFAITGESIADNKLNSPTDTPFSIVEDGTANISNSMENITEQKRTLSTLSGSICFLILSFVCFLIRKQ